MDWAGTALALGVAQEGVDAVKTLASYVSILVLLPLVGCAATQLRPGAERIIV